MIDALLIIAIVLMVLYICGWWDLFIDTYRGYKADKELAEYHKSHPRLY